jgi:hypothetical protein
VAACVEASAVVVFAGVARPVVFGCAVPAPLVAAVFASSGAGAAIEVASEASVAPAALVGTAACEDADAAMAAAADCLVAVVAAVTSAVAFAVAPPAAVAAEAPIPGSACGVAGAVAAPVTTAALAAMAAAAIASGLAAESPGPFVAVAAVSVVTTVTGMTAATAFCVVATVPVVGVAVDGSDDVLSLEEDLSVDLVSVALLWPILPSLRAEPSALPLAAASPVTAFGSVASPGLVVWSLELLAEVWSAAATLRDGALSAGAAALSLLDRCGEGAGAGGWLEVSMEVLASTSAAKLLLACVASYRAGFGGGAWKDTPPVTSDVTLTTVGLFTHQTCGFL